MFNRSNRSLICLKSGTSTMNPGKESNQGEKLTCGTTMAVSKLFIPSQAVLVHAEVPAVTECLNCATLTDCRWWFDSPLVRE